MLATSPLAGKDTDRRRVRVELALFKTADVMRRAEALAGNGLGPTAQDVLVFALLRGLAAIEREASPSFGSAPGGLSARATDRPARDVLGLTG